MKSNPRYHDIIAAMQLELDDDRQDQEESPNESAQRILAGRGGQNTPELNSFTRAQPNAYMIQPKGPVPHPQAQFRMNQIVPT